VQSEILFVSPEFGYGGIGNHTFKMVNILLDEGFRVKVHTTKNKKLPSSTRSNLEIVEIARPMLGFNLFNPLFDSLSSLHLKVREKPCLIVRTLPPFYIRAPIISNAVIPELAISHGVRRTSIRISEAKEKMDIKDKYLLSALGRMLIESSEQVFLNRAKRIVAVSEYTKRELVKQYNLDREKVEVIHNFVDNKIFKRKKNNEITSEIGKKVKNFKKSSFLAVFVGRPTPSKNFSLVYNIIRNFRNEPDLKFVIVGTKRNDQCVKEYTKGLKCSNVLFLGSIDNNILPDVYSLSDFLLITSLDENLPTVLLEAMACGTIPISTNVGGVPEAIEDCENGFLVRPNKKDFLNIIRYLVNCDHRTLSVISRNAEKTVKERFSAKIIQKNFVDTVNETISI
jgi:glycosyltransferase involved in cell wall biosynthesis